MFSPRIAQQLRNRGRDVVAVNERKELLTASAAGAKYATTSKATKERRSRRETLLAMPDTDVMALARPEQRAVVTNNLRDFRPMHAEAIILGGPGHFGMILVPTTYRRTTADTGRIVKALEAVLSEHPGDDDLANGETWL